MSLEIKHFYEFGNFRLDTIEGVLLRNGKPLPLTPKAFHLLKILIQNHGRIVNKDKLMTEIWADSFVEDGNLAVNAASLRKVLGDNANNPVFIETVPRRGYRFIAEVSDNFDGVQSNGNQDGLRQFSLPQNLKKLYLPATVSLIFVIGLTVVTLWYLFNGNAGSTPSANILSAPFRSERLSSTGDVAYAILSPNGKYVAYVDKSNRKYSVWLKQIETSENIQIVPPSDVFYLGLAFSWDGNSIYFVRRDQMGTTSADIYRVSAFGGIPVKVIENTQGWISVSPDDKQISFVRCEYVHDDFCSLYVADTNGENERRLLTRPEPIRIGDNQFSPDGKSIAFATGQSWNGSNEFVLSKIDLETGVEGNVTPRKFFHIKNIEWLPNGSGLLFSAKENLAKKNSIWQVSTDTEETTQLTKDDAEYSSLSLDKEANILVATKVHNDFRIYLASAEDPNNPKMLVAAFDVTFAPNGKIVYEATDSDIWTINAEGDEQRQLTSSAFSDITPRVSQDGRFVFFCSNRTGTNQVWRMNADGSNQIQLTKTEGGYPRVVTPDGKWVYFKSSLHRTLWRVAADGGEEVLISERTNVSVSPDGTLGACVFRDQARGNQVKIEVLSLDDKTVLKIFSLANPKLSVFATVWANDNRTLSYITENYAKTLTGNSAGGLTNSLWIQSMDEDKPHLVADMGEGEIRSLALAPDGKSFAFVRGNWIHDAFLIEGLK